MVWFVWMGGGRVLGCFRVLEKSRVVFLVELVGFVYKFEIVIGWENIYCWIVGWFRGEDGERI